MLPTDFDNLVEDVPKVNDVAVSDHASRKKPRVLTSQVLTS